MAKVAWIGGSIPVRQTEKVTVGGTYATGDTITLTIGGKSLVLTVGDDVALSDVVANLSNMVTGASFTAGYSSNAMGSEVGEFAQLSGTVQDSPDLLLFGQTDGRPFTLAVDNDSSSGTVVRSTEVTATGPHHANEAGNWSTGSLPDDEDEVVFDHRAISSVLYGLDLSTVTPERISITEGFNGGNLVIGLEDIASAGFNLQFEEHLERYLKFGNAADSIQTVINISCTSLRRARLNSGTGEAVLNGITTGPGQGRRNAVEWLGTHNDNEVNLARGSYAIAFGEDEESTVAELNVGREATVFCGPGAGIASVNAHAGDTTIGSGVTTLVCQGGNVTISAGNITTAEIDSGQFSYRGGGTITNLRAGSDGIADFSRNPRPRTVTNAEFHRDSSLRDPHGTVTWSNGIDFVRCSPSELREFRVAPHQTWTPSSI